MNRKRWRIYMVVITGITGITLLGAMGFVFSLPAAGAEPPTDLRVVKPGDPSPELVDLCRLGVLPQKVSTPFGYNIRYEVEDPFILKYMAEKYGWPWTESYQHTLRGPGYTASVILSYSLELAPYIEFVLPKECNVRFDLTGLNIGAALRPNAVR